MRCIISEYHVVEIAFKDEGVLIQTLKEMGYEPSIHQNAVNLYGYQGDKREQKAHIVIPRSQVGVASNDVGFEKVDGGFVLHASEYDRSWRNGSTLKQLKQGYAENKLKKTISVLSNYHIFSRKQKENGQIEIQLKIVD